MYVLEAGAAKAEIRGQEEIDCIIGCLAGDGYRPVLRGAASELLRSVGENRGFCSDEVTKLLIAMMASGRYPQRRHAPIGELFFIGESAVILQPFEKQLVVCELRNHGTGPIRGEIQLDVEKAAKGSLDGRRLRGMNFDWCNLSIEALLEQEYYGIHRIRANRRLAQETLKTNPVVMSEEGVADADLLSNPDIRSFIYRLVQAARVRSKDARQLPDHREVEPLSERGLLRKEFLIVCRRDSGTTLATVDSKEDITSEYGSRLRCSSCGNKFSEERIQDVYAPSDKARKLIDGSHWMTIWITNILLESGIDVESISWGATAGEDEIDLVVDLLDCKIFLELKDREFGLGDAYPFGSRMERYGADFGLIISTEAVAEEVKNFLRERQGSPIYTLEGWANIPSDLTESVGRIATEAASRLAGGLCLQAGLDIRPVLDAWLRR